MSHKVKVICRCHLVWYFAFDAMKYLHFERLHEFHHTCMAMVREDAWKCFSIPSATLCVVMNRSATSSGRRSRNRSTTRRGHTRTSVRGARQGKNIWIEKNKHYLHQLLKIWEYSGLHSIQVLSKTTVTWASHLWFYPKSFLTMRRPIDFSWECITLNMFFIC